MRFLLVAMGLVLLGAEGGCVAPMPDNPSNPYPELKTFAIAPLMNLTTERKLDTEVLGQVFYTEFAKFKGFELVSPEAVRKAMSDAKNPLAGPEDAIRLGRALQVDAVVVAGITEYHPYRPPRLGLAIQIYPTKMEKRSYLDISKLSQAGKPFAISTDRTKHPIVARVAVYDSSEKDVLDQLHRYAARHDTSRGLGVETYLRLMDEYVRFAFNVALREIVNAEAARTKPKKTVEPPSDDPAPRHGAPNDPAPDLPRRRN